MPKIIGENLAQHRAATRRRLLDAFGALLAERGYDQIRLSDVAARAGVGRTAVYNHVADKEALALEFAMDETQRYVDAVEQALSQADGPVDQLRTYVRMHFALSRDLHTGLGPRLASFLSPEALGQMREHVVLVEELLARVLAGGRDLGTFEIDDLRLTTGLVIACLQGRQVPDADGPEREAAVEMTERFVLRAVGVQP
ncbi:AcrR family transcriptional regulator [Mumia flava]|uniref:AcrR family transcriptional regulator n=1 Tax=Mumia flava TaxID=1348852 RepID=A0A0B2BDQ0_9ACTN|nr:TetR/AcrR family transcriptional regulator [Mumia flava]PJJ58487.1 AcrR family transcriptional regulator [Mumia flava]